MLESWIDRLWPNRVNSEGFFSLWFDPGSSSYFAPLKSNSFKQLEQQIAQAQLRQQDSYFCLGTRVSDLGKFQRGGERQVLHVPGLWLDLDVHSPEGAHNSDKYVTSRELGLQLVKEIEPLPPSVIVDSGYGLHLYWLFDEPAENNRVTQGILKSFQARMQKHFESKGFALDRKDNVADLLRVPGTLNFKCFNSRSWKHPHKSPKNVAITVDNNVRYPLSTWTRTESLRASPSPSPSPVIQQQSRPQAVHPTGGGAPLFRDTLQAYVKGKEDLERCALVARLLAGESLALAGSRDGALNRVCSVVAWTCARVHPDLKVSDVVELFRPSLTEWASEPGASLSVEQELEKAQDKLDRALRDFRETKEREESERKEFFSGLLPSIRLAEGSSSPAPAEGNPSFEPSRFLLIQHMSSYWVWSPKTKGYVGPFSKEGITAVFRDFFEDVPSVRLTNTIKGVEKRRTLDDLRSEYGTVAKSLQYSMLVPSSSFDPETLTFTEAACAPRNLTPLYDENIHKWLCEFGGVEREKFLDWLAGVPRVDRQLCALYPAGSPGTGKTLLMNGLARIWTTKGYVELRKILGPWNTDLLWCPLVGADEGISSANASTSELRDIIARSSHTITRKFSANADLVGCVRLIISANHDKALEFKREVLEAEDHEALAERFLYIKVTEEPRKFLESLGPNYTHDRGWITEDRIARHVLWLSQTRKLPPGGRFLVEGHRSEMSMKLRTAGNGAFLEFMAFLTDREADVKELTAAGKLFLGNGKFLITTAAVMERWSSLITHTRPFTATRVGSALNQLSVNRGQQVRFRGRRVWDIDLKVLLYWVENNSIGDPDKIRELVSRVVSQEDQA